MIGVDSDVLGIRLGSKESVLPPLHRYLNPIREWDFLPILPQGLTRIPQEYNRRSFQRSCLWDQLRSPPSIRFLSQLIFSSFSNSGTPKLRNGRYVMSMVSDSFIQYFISATRRKPVPINVDDDDDDDDDEIMKDVDVRDRHSSIPVTHRRPAPTTSKDTHDIDSETDSESGRKSSEEEELDNEDLMTRTCSISTRLP